MTTSAPSSHDSSPEDRRFLSREVCDDIFDRVFAFAPDGRLVVGVTSTWEGTIRWARNRTSLASNRRRIQVRVTAGYQSGRSATVSTNQLDDISLQAAVRAAQRNLDIRGGPGSTIHDFPLKAPELTPPETRIWSEATFNTTNEVRGEIARLLTESAEQQQMLAAGFIAMRAGQLATRFRTSQGLIRERYDRYTTAECSMTVRDSQGTGAGWAGRSSYDWTAINGPALAARALEKCLASRNPVRIEPGRYTVILEPQAVYQLVNLMFSPMITSQKHIEDLGREGRDAYFLGHDAALNLGRSKLGLKIVDERVTIRHVPSDPNQGVIPVSYETSDNGDAFWPITPITWIKRGVLTALHHGRSYALEKLNENLPHLWRPGLYMDGGNSSVDEMVETTKQGVLVTRFSGVQILDLNSVLCTGVTRDGLWLIENGSITKSVHNFRFTESPIFLLNQIQLLGKPMPVFTGGDVPSPAYVPPIKATDFSFTSLVDAI